MGLLLSEPPPKNFLVKHSFNADEESEKLLVSAEKILRDKTEFINRCIQHAGPLVIENVNTERNQHVAELLHERPRPVGKRKAG